MEAGLLYTDAGPALAGALLLAFFYASLRDRASGVAWFTGLVLIAPFFTYRDTLQAAGIGTALLLLGAATLSVERPRLRWPSSPIDRVMILFALVMSVAALRGLLAGNPRTYWAGDAYHYLLIGPGLYAITRLALRGGHAAHVIGRVLWIATVVGLLTLLVLLASRSRPDWMWLVGGPLDEGGIRLKPDFGFPLLALVLALGRAQARPSWRAWVPILVLTTVLVLTYKRTFWVSSIAAWLLVVLLGLRLHGLRAVCRAWLPLAPALGVAIAIATLLGANTESLARRTEESLTPTAAPTMHTRWAEWRAVVTDVRAHPIGHGFGAERTLDGGRRAHYVHSVYLQWALQGGLVGVMAGVILFAVATGLGVRHAGRAADVPGATGATFGLAVAGLVLLSVYTPMTGMLLGVHATLLDPPSS